MASFYAKRGDFDTAIQAWQDAKKACEAIDEWSKMMGVRLLEQLGALHAEQAARAAELEALQSAAAQREVLEKVTGALASKLFARIAELQLEMGNSSESERFQEKAAAALKKMANIDEVEGETMSAEVVLATCMQLHTALQALNTAGEDAVLIREASTSSSSVEQTGL
ncbi:unnamed protein product [Durusdinium trenchii]|uniref:Uncharacterized protein n=1 Tax=Durusdinium trenchii TaxID=1381693 RepID=A0ABP0HTI5_9DINO